MENLYETVDNVKSFTLLEDKAWSWADYKKECDFKYGGEPIDLTNILHSLENNSNIYDIKIYGKTWKDNHSYIDYIELKHPNKDEVIDCIEFRYKQKEGYRKTYNLFNIDCWGSLEVLRSLHYPFEELLPEGVAYPYQEYIDAIEKYFNDKNSLSDFYVKAKEIDKKLSKLKSYTYVSEVAYSVFHIEDIIEDLCDDEPPSFDKIPNSIDILDKIEEYLNSIDGDMGNLRVKTLEMLNILKPYVNIYNHVINNLR